MITKEQYEMIEMCAEAKHDKKTLQFKGGRIINWTDSVASLGQIVENILSERYIYRIKPEPKTVTVRLAWLRSSNGSAHIDIVKLYNANTASDTVAWPDLIKWADEEKTYEVPE
jgi:hypothetical protein